MFVLDTTNIEQQLQSSQEEVVSLRSQLSLQKEKCGLLKHEIETLKKELHKLSREKEDIIRSSRYQLEEKSTAIAQLVSKLHQTQRMLQKPLETSEMTATPSSIPHGYYPTPPKEPSPSEGLYRIGRIIRRNQRSLTSPQELSSPSTDSISSGPSSTPPPLIALPSLPRPPSKSSIRRAGCPQLTNQIRQPPRGTWDRDLSPSSSQLFGTSTDSQLKTRDQIILEQVKQPQLLERALKKETSKPVLPPIQSEEDMTVHDFKLQSVSKHHSNRRQRHMLNKKGSGLSSAPCSVRLMNYAMSQSVRDEDKDSDEGEPEGLLMVKHGMNERRELLHKLQHQSDTK